MSAEHEGPPWRIGLAVAVCAHAGVVAGALGWPGQAPPPAPPPAAMVIDLSPMMQSPDTPAHDLPPAPDVQEEVPDPPPPPPPEPEPEPEPLPEPDPVVEDPPVPVPVQKTPPRTPPPPAKPRPPEPPRDTPPPDPPSQAAAPPQVQAPPAEAMTAPTVGQPSDAPSNALPTWQGVLLAHLERHKRYPHAARSRREEGVVLVAFTIDRNGTVLKTALHRSSGHGRLDEEALDLPSRAQPLPPPPPEVPGATIDLVVPVQFFVK